MKPLLVALSDQQHRPESTDKLVELCALAQPGSLLIVLRDRESSAEKRLRMGRRLRAASRKNGQLFAVSDRVDLALLLEADGVHLPADGMTPLQAQTLLDQAGRPTSWISRSSHDLQSLQPEDLRCLSALFVSPFAAARKGRAALGRSEFRNFVDQWSRRAPHLAFYGLGGVDASNAADCLQAGGHGVVVMGAAHDVERARALLEALGVSATQG